MSDTRSERNRWERVREWLVDVYDPVMAREPRRSLSEQSMMLAEQSEAAAYREAVEHWAKRCLEYAEGSFSDEVKGVYISIANEMTAALDELKGQGDEQPE